ncbi:MlaE family ABC transporter permease [Janthinobacterium sp. LB2P10]|uniref:MlaE family ABC transporter permease n=1 Tax=Janthinobacterium sp. LB2P10 TaxID=3424194 RepID=UPI003F21D199
MMTVSVSLIISLRRLHRASMAWLVSWWHMLHFATLMFSLALSPSSYQRANRPILAHRLVSDTAPNLVWFSVACALLSLVLIRIVVVSAQSYGLSHYALEMVVRVLVLELIPLTAALFVALRLSLPDGIAFAQMRASGMLDTMQRQGVDLMRREYFPRVMSGIFAVWMLAIVSCVSSLILAYVSIYGFTPWALPGYTRVVGQIFNPAVALILMLKVIFFSFAVALIPLASSYYQTPAYGRRNRVWAAHGLSEMLRLFSVILLIEVATLMGNYY